MYSASDFEKLWFLYKTEGDSKGISLNSFCASHVTFNASTPLALQRYIAALQLPSYGYCFRKKRLAESAPCQDLRENLIITKKYVLKMSVPTEIGAQMLSFLWGRHFWTLT